MSDFLIRYAAFRTHVIVSRGIEKPGFGISMRMSDRQNFFFTGVAADGALLMPQTGFCSSSIDIDFPDKNVWFIFEFFPTNGTYVIMLRSVVLPFIGIFM